MTRPANVMRVAAVQDCPVLLDRAATLLGSMERVHDRLHTIRAFEFTVCERVIVSEAQQIAIVEAIRPGDRAQAAALMAQHINQSKDEIRGIMLPILSRAYSGRM